MFKEVVIRRAAFTDAEKITDYNMRLAKETEDKKLDAKTVLKGVRALLKDSSKGFYLVAETNEIGVVGQLMVTFEWSDWTNSWY